MANIDKLTPEKGKNGHTGIVHGSGFTGSSATIKFGTKSANAIETTSDKVVKFEVPVTDASDRRPGDPTRCDVKVAIAGATASFIFEYDPSGPAPVISSFATVPPAGTITLTGTGLNFAAGGRTPTTAFFVDLGVVGSAAPGSDTQLTVTFSNPAIGRDGNPSPFPAGSYTAVVGFSDGSAASCGFQIGV